MKNKFALAAWVLLFLSLSIFPSSSLSLNVRVFDHSEFTRLVFESNQGFHYNINQANDSMEIRLKEKAEIKEGISVQSILITKVIHLIENNKSIFNILLKSPYKIQRSFILEKPFRLVFDLEKAKANEPTVQPAQPIRPARPIQQESKTDVTKDVTKKETPKEVAKELNLKENKEKELIKQESKSTEPEKPVSSLSSKKNMVIETICIDPGHGGSDLGAVGHGDSVEKNITIKVANMLKKMIMSRLGLQVVMTRENDTDVSLNSRVSIANNRKAHMFVSIHVNSSYRKAARGSETFFVSLKATDQEAFQLSQKENQSVEGESGDVIQDDELKMILWDMAQTEYIKESSRLAEYIQEELNVLLQTKNRGVKQAPFRVLMRAAMPAVLVEIAFLSNIDEEKKLQDDAFLNTVANAVYTGISKYIRYYNNPTAFLRPDKQETAQ